MPTEPDAAERKEAYKRAQLAAIERRNRLTNEVHDTYNVQVKILTDAKFFETRSIEAARDRAVEAIDDLLDKACKHACEVSERGKLLAKAQRDIDLANVKGQYAIDLRHLYLTCGEADDGD